MNIYRKHSTMPILLLLIFCLPLITSCGPKMKIDYNKVSPEVKNYFGSERAVSPYMWVLYKYGLPLQANESPIYEIKDLFCTDYPRNLEVWEWKRNSALFAYPGDIMLDYIPPKAAPGELEISDIDTCTKDESFCVEFTIDGLEMYTRQVCYRFDIMLRRSRTYTYLFTSPPIIGRKGLRSVKVVSFINKESLETKKKKLLLLVHVRDFLSGEKREGVVELCSSKSKKGRR